MKHYMIVITVFIFCLHNILHFHSFYDATNTNEYQQQTPSTSQLSKHANYENVHNVQSIPSRIFKPWNYSFPCYNGYNNNFRSGEKLRGLVYIKSRKTASSTLAGINLRIAHQKSANTTNIITTGNNSNSKKKNKKNKNNNKQKDEKICANTYTHNYAKMLKVSKRGKDKTFLWTFVRNPSSQFLSQFFHFEVSRKNIQPTIKNLKSYANHEFRRELRYPQLSVIYPYELKIDRKKLIITKDEMDVVNEILTNYDFIGLVERFDESLVLLRLILGLDAHDILYLPAKVGGAYDGGGYNNSCTYIQPSVKTPEIEEYLSSQQWRKRNNATYILHDAINLSLDRTIEYIGKSKFNNALMKHKRLMSIVNKECAPNAIFPCSNDGVLQMHLSEKNCYRKDAGCGYPCIDKLYDNSRK